MRLSFEDDQSLKEVAESLRFNNPASDRDTLGLEQEGSIPSEESREVLWGYLFYYS